MRDGKAGDKVSRVEGSSEESMVAKTACEAMRTRASQVGTHPCLSCLRRQNSPDQPHTHAGANGCLEVNIYV